MIQFAPLLLFEFSLLSKRNYGKEKNKANRLFIIVLIAESLFFSIWQGLVIK